MVKLLLKYHLCNLLDSCMYNHLLRQCIYRYFGMVVLRSYNNSAILPFRSSFQYISGDIYIDM